MATCLLGKAVTPGFLGNDSHKLVVRAQLQLQHGRASGVESTSKKLGIEMGLMLRLEVCLDSGEGKLGLRGLLKP